MKISILMAVVSLLILAVGVYVLVLLIRALRKYILRARAEGEGSERPIAR